MICQGPCVVDKPPEEFSKSWKLPWGLVGWCNHCYLKQRSWAWGRYRQALNSGSLVRPARCAIGQHLPVGKDHIVGHHINYHFPSYVHWYCNSHHRWVHRGMAHLHQLERAQGLSITVWSPLGETPADEIGVDKA